MLFNSIDYLLLLVPSLVLYWLIPALKGRQLILFVASIYFYMSWNKVFAVLLLLMVFINWILGFYLEKKRTRFILALAVGLNLCILCYFKYINFIIQNVLAFYGVVTGHHASEAPYLTVILPLGISFFVFEFISYHVDIYRRSIDSEKNFVIFSLFVMFFPHLIAGPICRANSIFSQLKTKLTFSPKYIFDGIFIFLCGLFLKIVIADNLSPYVNNAYSNLNSVLPTEVLVAAVTFSVVILCDFWGYSTMALGSAIMFGIYLPINFNLPYLSTSLQEFWRRWHISLSMWLRDYLYISLGGSKKGVITTYRNLFLVMLIGGIWHGAGWCFLVWGCAHGIWLVAERITQSVTARLKINRKVLSILGGVLTFTFVTLAWIPFRLNNIDSTTTVFQKLFQLHLSDILSFSGYSSLIIYFCMFLLLHYPINLYVNSIMSGNKLSIAKNLILSFWLSILIIIFGSTTVESFIYFQF